MRVSVFVLAFVGLGSFATVGCAGGVDDATEAGASELRATTFTRLDVAKQADVLATMQANFDEHLATCLAAHPEITTITKENARRLTQVQNVSYMELNEAIDGILEQNHLAKASPTELERLLEGWGRSQLAPHTAADGTVSYETVDSLAMYAAVRQTEEKLSIAGAENPSGANIATLREQWRAVENRKPSLDSAFLRPVRVNQEPTIGEIKKHFKLPFQASLVSGAWQAVDDMAAAHEGPGEAKEEFAPIAKTLKHARGIKKRFYFAGNGNEWSTNVLVVLDDRNQLWGFSMGYSE